MRKIALILIAGAAMYVAAPASSAQAGWREGPPWEPGWYAKRVLLKFGNAKRLYHEGCLRWGWQNNTWYNTCIGPAAPAGAVVVKY